MTMSEEGSFSGCSKARSASICAPGCSSMEALVMNSQLPPSGSGTPDTGTPSGRRRRPAARSQVSSKCKNQIKYFESFFCFYFYFTAFEIVS
ncbi:hypothetical protein Phum_PHUM565850 [Pediculus humanus corporis]|uniref:Uncharacterized protein n=1 Tax=Pediculus humanus subsp. corporis TaxID=121224 RepID=E0W0Z5_PEDHC|nr:uncharacterized protein Phum_PHUM565850 [Pediculus humanus corporis]EEB19300.1 hypothetical protein Phum_PHUM565850 [Pediculus humanus corporis]